MEINDITKKLKTQQNLLDECILFLYILKDRFNLLYSKINYEDRTLENISNEIKNNHLIPLKKEFEKIKDILELRDKVL